MPSAVFFGNAGVSLVVCLAAVGACYGNARVGTALMTSDTYGRRVGAKGYVALVMSTMISIYSLVIAFFITNTLGSKSLSLPDGLLLFSSGLSGGLALLACGLGIGAIGSKGIELFADSLFIAYMLSLLLCEAIGLLGTILSILSLPPKT
ncbi:MAG: V-type ATPase V0 subunit c (proteolipid subunit) [Amphiamblys sp. WSBS2006]|nr:MAG: V-type ATPase V0 subunit c (proteolipid subunit) [Amphiamblys sp. WSBS2006]